MPLVLKNPSANAGDIRDVGSVLEKKMEPWSSILAWKIPWTEEPGGQQSMGSHRVRLNLTTKTTTTYTTWTARRSSKSILKEINSEYSLEGLMLKLKLQYFGHLI